MWHEIFWYPTKSVKFPSNFRNVGLTFFISKRIASHQRLLLFSESICNASFTDLGMRMPYLCDRNQYLDFTLANDLLRRLIINFTHHLNAGSSTNLCCMENSANCIGNESFTSLRLFQVVEPSFYLINTSQPLVVFLLFITPFEVR